MMAPRVAVVIATYRRPDLLRRCLDALARQTLAGSEYEVIVVDDGHTADTREVVLDFDARHGGAPAFRYLESQGTRGPAGARNVGWRHAHAPLIAFTDDDTVPASAWLEEGCQAMSGPWVAVGGRLVVPLEGEPTDHARNTQGLEKAEFATANAFVRRDALRKIGGFDERYTRAWREDSDLQFTLMRECGPVGWASSAVVMHPVRPVPWGFSLKTQANVFFDALLFKKHPALYRSRIRPRPPWRYYLIVLCALASLVLALAGQGGLAVAAVALALGAVAVFAIERLSGTAHTPAHIAEMLLTSMAIPFLSVYWRVKGALHFRVPFM